MQRCAPTLLASALTVAALAGCGSSSTSTGESTAKAPAARSTPAASFAEITDGRSGAATRAARSGASRELSPGGALDPTDPPAGPNRRDGVGAGDACADTGLSPAADNVPRLQAATLCLLNGERADRALPPFRVSAPLSRAAGDHASDMVAKSYFAHKGADGSEIRGRIQATGYLPANRRWVIGENLAWGTGALATPKAIVNAWMNSSGHRANVLHAEYREIGFGIVIGNPKARNGFGATYANAFGFVADGSSVTAAAPVTSASKRRASSRRRALARRSAARKSAARKSAARKSTARARAAALRAKTAATAMPVATVAP